MEHARTADHGRRAHRARGHDRALRQTVIILRASTSLREHQSSREATPQVLGGRIRLTAGTQTLEAITSDLLTVPARPTRSARSRTPHSCCGGVLPTGGRGISMEPRIEQNPIQHALGSRSGSRCRGVPSTSLTGRRRSSRSRAPAGNSALHCPSGARPPHPGNGPNSGDVPSADPCTHPVTYEPSAPGPMRPDGEPAGAPGRTSPGIHPGLRRVHPAPEPDDGGFVTESGLENEEPVLAVQTTVIGEDGHARVQRRPRVGVRLVERRCDGERNGVRRSLPRRDARPRSSEHVGRDDRSIRA